MKEFDNLQKNNQTTHLSLQEPVDTAYCQFNGLRQTLRVLNNETTLRKVSAKGLLNKLNNQGFYWSFT